MVSIRIKQNNHVYEVCITKMTCSQNMMWIMMIWAVSFIYLWIMEYLFRQSSLCPARPSWMWQNWGRLLSYHPGQIINGQTILCSKLQSNVVEIWIFSHKYTFLCIITKDSLLDTLFPSVHLKYIILTLKQLIIMKNV